VTGVQTCALPISSAPENYPGNAAPKLWKPVEETVYCLVDETGSVCLTRREDGEWRGGLWDFPAEPPASLVHLTETGSVVTRHVVTNHRIRRTTKVYRVERKALIAAGGLDCCLVPLEALTSGRKVHAKTPPVGSALLKTVKVLIKLLIFN
jgi:adenine-specific DNA glycosylase